MTLRLLLPLLVVAGLGAWLLMSGDDPDADLATHDARKAETADDAMRADAALHGRPETQDEDTASSAPSESGTGTSPPAAEPGTESTPGGSRARRVFRDVHTGKPVDGLTLRTFHAKFTSGVKPTPPRHEITAADGSRWHLIMAPGKKAGTPLWVVRLVDVRVQVTVADRTDLNPSVVSFEPRLIDTNRAAKEHMPEGAPMAARLGYHVVRSSWKVVHTPHDLGDPFVVRLPRIPEIMLRAKIPGYRQSWVVVPLEEDPERPPLVHLHFERGPTIKGRLVDPDGKPVTGVRTMLLVKRPAPRERKALEHEMYGASSGCWVFGTDDDPYFVFTTELQLDAQGRFTADVPIDGEVGIKVKSSSYHTREVLYGEIREDRTLEPLVLQPVEKRSRVQLVVNAEGVLVPIHNLSIVIEREPAESFFPRETISLDADGSIPTHELTRGKAYQVFVPGLDKVLEHMAQPKGARWLPHVTLTWDGEEKLELDAVRRP